MSEVPQDLKYTKNHEWLRMDDNGIATVGITDHAQALLGDLVFVETPEIGSNFGADDACAVVESVKAASDVYCPIAGEVVETNAVLSDSPELINDQPYDDGWIFQLKIDDEDDLEGLMDADEYQSHCEEEDH
ncbi:MAG: glycine cleavage system protein GcvH [Gammaproteobacteria bacterium]|nr:MAG: glycine cleavage system protein GcvH [Gammaproteobacteria bacterium]